MNDQRRDGGRDGARDGGRGGGRCGKAARDGEGLAQLPWRAVENP